MLRRITLPAALAALMFGIAPVYAGGGHGSFGGHSFSGHMSFGGHAFSGGHTFRGGMYHAGGGMSHNFHSGGISHSGGWGSHGYSGGTHMGGNHGSNHNVNNNWNHQKQQQWQAQQQKQQQKQQACVNGSCNATASASGGNMEVNVAGGGDFSSLAVVPFLFMIPLMNQSPPQAVCPMAMLTTEDGRCAPLQPVVRTLD
ncbi:MAG: hypothetical protein KGH79_04845 [Patescibacteria group bacterium]|nr:hypothetical protein [Patescibacteria group bacterium]